MHVRCLALRTAITLLVGVGLALGLLCLLDGRSARVVADFAPRRAEHPELRALRTPGSVITVCLDGGCDFDSVQAAVDAASEGDEIRVAAGTYTGVSARAGVTQVVYINKSVTVRGGYTGTDWSEPHPMSTPTTLDAEGQGRVLYIAGGISPTIEGLRITGGSARRLGGGPAKEDVGGGVYVGTGAATISGCQVVSNTALYGGGLYLRRGSAKLMRNQIAGNVAWRSDSIESYGGGAYLWEDDSVLVANTIQANRADWGGGLYLSASRALISGGDVVANTVRYYGGGLCSAFGAPRLIANLFTSNVAEVGGGLWIWQANPLTLVDNALIDNVAGWGGGGLAAVECVGVIGGNTLMGNRAHNGGGLLLDNGRPALINNRVVGNVTTRKGGGLYLYWTDAVLTNTLVAHNAADESGSGLSIIGGEARLLHTTLARNGWREGATDGAGGSAARPLTVAWATQARVDDGDATGLVVDDATVALTNTILVGHSVGVYANGEPEFNSVVTLQATLWGNETDWSGPGSIAHADDYWGDPAFVDPDAGDFHIGPSSAAVDQGVDAGADHDMDGDPRPVPAGGGFDLGADEYAESDLSASRKRVYPRQAAAGDVLTYTIILVNRGSVSSRDTLLVDAIPTQTTYISDSAMTSAGVLTDGDSIHWSGTLTPDQPVTITFLVTLGEASLVKNTAVVTDAKGGVTTLWALVNGQRLWMPLILK